MLAQTTKLDSTGAESLWRTNRRATLFSARSKAEEIAKVERDIIILKNDYPKLSPDAALLKLRDDFHNATDENAKWTLYEKLRDIEPRLKALQARHANGTNAPTVVAAIIAEKVLNV